ncbi:hypothetical protein MMC29_002820 [Sticta canariensis]|nr:hypothetical protein [Sticta canariensis]
MALRVIGIDDGSKKKPVMDYGSESFIDVKEHDNESIAAEVVKLSGGLGTNTGDPVPIAKSYPAKLVFKQATVMAIAVGSRADAVEVLGFTARGIVKTHFRVEKMDSLTEMSGNLHNLVEVVAVGDAIMKGQTDNFLRVLRFSKK